MVQVDAWITTGILFWSILSVDIPITHCNNPQQGRCPYKVPYKPIVVKASGACVPTAPKSCDDNNYYYSYDGSCNTAKYPQRGQAGSLMTFFIKPRYSDNYSAPRKTKNGSDLVNARLVSSTIFKTRINYNTQHNGLYYAYCQFFTHDMGYQAVTPSKKPCCVKGKVNTPLDPQCLDASILPNDPVYGKLGIQCNPVTRAVDAKYLNCKVKKNQGMTFQSGFLDVSMVYGPSNDTVKAIRTFRKGLLKTNTSKNDGSFIYPAKIPSCALGGLIPNASTPCYVTANSDNRTMQNPELLVISLIFFTTHNKVCLNLTKLNPSWNDEKLFQECRRITIAFYQHIFYAFIQASFGIGTAQQWGLVPVSSGYRTGYSDKNNPTLMNDASSFGMRFGHSDVRGYYQDGVNKTRYLPYGMPNKYFNLEFIEGSRNGCLRITDMYASLSCEKQDNWFTDAINSKLFADPSGKIGGDLNQADILRCRQYGQAGYKYYRLACGLPQINSWAEFNNISIDPSVTKDLEKLYPDGPGDADAYPLAFLEKPCGDSTMGPMFTCICMGQFYNTINGDYKWYDFPSAKFTMAQLKVIRSVTFAAIVCFVFYPFLKTVPKNAFYIPSESNPLCKCSELIKIFDFTPWTEY